MSYVDQEKSFGRSSIAAVALVHLGIGYALFSGLAYKVIRFVDPPIRASILPDDAAPPPPHDLPPPTATTQPRVSVTAPPLVDRPSQDVPDMNFPLQHPGDMPVLLRSQTETLPPPPPQHASQARGATADAGRASWVTSDDYPSSALRAGVEGTVGISVSIDASGHVTACSVTAGSGNAALDAATCRLYSRRARFAPALDDEGRPIASTRPDRVRWTIPPQ